MNRNQISIHAPRVGSDDNSSNHKRTPPHFNPRSPCGERQQRYTNFKVHLWQRGRIFAFLRGNAGIPIKRQRCETGFLMEIWVRTSRHFLFIMASQSENQGVLRHIAALAAKMLHLLFVLATQVVKPQRVLFGIHDGKKLCLQTSALPGIQQTLEYGVLHPLPVVHAFFRNLPQPSFPGGILGVYVIGDENQHHITSIKKVGNRPCRPECTGPAAAPAHRGSCPSSFFPPDRDGSG